MSTLRLTNEELRDRLQNQHRHFTTHHIDHHEEAASLADLNADLLEALEYSDAILRGLLERLGDQVSSSVKVQLEANAVAIARAKKGAK